MILVFDGVNAVFQNAEPVTARWQVETVFAVGIGGCAQASVGFGGVVCPAEGEHSGCRISASHDQVNQIQEMNRPCIFVIYIFVIKML